MVEQVSEVLVALSEREGFLASGVTNFLGGGHTEQLELFSKLVIGHQRFLADNQ